MDSNPTSRRFFPAELIDLFIDHNHDDPQSLMAYALVSKQWTPASRYHLFCKVGISHTNAREFIELLMSPHCTFLTIVRGLDVQFVSGSQRWLSEFSRRLSILDKTTITFLAISGSRNTVVREEARIGLSLFSTQVKHLEVGAVSFEAFADFASLLCEFTALESLSCASTYQIAVLPEKLQFSAPLQGLNLAFPSTTLVFEFLFLQDVLPTITSLSLSHLAVADYSILTRYLDTPNSNLQSFNIKMDSNFSGVTLGTFTEKLKMTQLKALRHLIVETTPRLSPEQAFALLATISSLQLETLEISVQLMQGVARMDILLSGNRFDFLKRLLVIGSSWAEVRQFFPRCDAKNVLQEGGNTLI